MQHFQLSRRFCLALPFVFLSSFTVNAQQTSVPKPALRLVALGDSLSAGYNLPAKAAFPSILERVLKAKGYNVVVENAGVSGDTASGGRDRLAWSVPDGTDLVIVELGANDALRGIDPKITEEALAEILTSLRSRKINALLAGMLAPPNYGPEYAKAFNGIYGRLAARFEVPLYPFFLDGVVDKPALKLPDGLHPTEAGVEEIVRRITPIVEETIKKLAAPR